MEARGDSIPVFPARFDATRTHALRRSDVPVDRGTTSAEPPDTTGSVIEVREVTGAQYWQLIERNRQRLVDETLKRFGRIDLLVNNAAVAPRARADVLETDEESFDEAIAVNLRAPFFLTQRVAREMLRQLKTGGGVGILIDQRVREDQGIEVPFFGHPAWTHPILARVARKTGAPVVPTFALREAPGRYSLSYEEPLMVEGLTEAEREDVPLTARYMAVLEVAIRERPDQWLWYHDRWKQLRIRN